MIIALDYDETYSLDPDLWNTLIKIIQKKGHKVYCVTMRYPEENFDIEDTIGKLCKIIYTSRKAKQKFLANIGIFPDIWIDDKPHFILEDSEFLLRYASKGILLE